MRSDSFQFWLDFYHEVLDQLAILFNQLQIKKTDLSQLKSQLSVFKLQLNLIKNKYITAVKSTESQIKEIKTVLELIDEDVTLKLNFKGHLLAESLLDTTQFEDYETSFPMNTLRTVCEYYEFFKSNDLKVELELLYGRKEFRTLATLPLINNFIYANQLTDIFPEVVKVIQLLLTIPMTTVDAERQFSTLKRIKSAARNRMGEDRLNALTAISVSKTFFNEPKTRQAIIDEFAINKERRLELVPK